jgi:glycosyltransferase involved in cell wall biosynthesis|tara:strand:- start:13795 stop:14613 length:819 start_codon:yes stop_codon:yes gene_type:complete
MTFNNINFVENPIEHGGLRTKGIFKQSSEVNPLISIITVVLNGENNLEESINSLHKQNYKNIEHIIIDGGSSDKTIEIIKKYENKIDYWCQKKDQGIYDAFNTGMKLAKGDYLGFLNSDDIYTENAFKILLTYIKNFPDKDFIFGAVKKHWGVLYGYKPYKIKWSWGFYSSHSTGFFIKLNSAKKVGLYNLKYKYSSDWDYFYRMIVKHKLNGIGSKKNELFGIFRRGGFSSKISFRDHFFEEITIRLDNNQNKILVLLIFIYKYLKHFKKM